MITITGKPVCSGIAFGPVFVFSREESTIKRHHIESSDDEIARFESARQQTISELGMLYDKALAEVGEANAMIFQIHQMMQWTIRICVKEVRMSKTFRKDL